MYNRVLKKKEEIWANRMKQINKSDRWIINS
jgi:hypothetical protein